MFDLSNPRVRRSSQSEDTLVINVLVPSPKGEMSIEVYRNTVSEIFQAAIEYHASKWVNFLIENYRCSSQVSHNSQSFWVRKFSQNDITREVENLKKRENIELPLMRGHKSDRSNYTEYSPATFICSGYNISLFGGDWNSTGVILRAQNRVIDYWYSGLIGEELTRDIDFTQKVLKEYQCEDGHHFKNIKEDEILRNFPKCVRQGKMFKHAKLDKYGVIERAAYLPWNEGLFRYKASEISGILVNPKNGKSIQAAFELRRVLVSQFQLTASDLPYLVYEQDTKSLSRISSKELEDALKADQQRQFPTSSSRDILFRRDKQQKLESVGTAYTSTRDYHP